MKQNNNKTLSIIAYLCVIALLVVLSIFLFKRSVAPKEAEVVGELPQQDWESKETSVGKIDDIVVNQTEETSVSESEVPFIDDTAEETTLSEEIIITEDDPFTKERKRLGDEYALYCSLGRVTNQVEWTNVGILSSTEHEIHYQVGSYDVRLLIAGGTLQNYEQQIIDLSESVSGTVQHDYISYSPSRIEDAHSYERYVISYQENDRTMYIYYYISQISDSEVYIVNITSPNIIEDADSFGVLDYFVES